MSLVSGLDPQFCIIFFTLFTNFYDYVTTTCYCIRYKNGHLSAFQIIYQSVYKSKQKMCKHSFEPMWETRFYKQCRDELNFDLWNLESLKKSLYYQLYCNQQEKLACKNKITLAHKHPEMYAKITEFRAIQTDFQNTLNSSSDLIIFINLGQTGKLNFQASNKIQSDPSRLAKGDVKNNVSHFFKAVFKIPISTDCSNSK